MRRTRSGETGLPATMPVRHVEGGCSSNEGSRMRSSNMVGTPCTTVTRSRRIRFNASRALNRSWSTSVAPAVTATATTCTPKTPTSGTQLMLEFVEAERGVERHQGHTLVGRREKGHHPFRPVRQIDRQPVTRFDAETAQRLAERPRLPFDLRIGHPARPEDQELPVW